MTTLVVGHCVRSLPGVDSAMALFTAETAREFAAKAHEARRRKTAEREAMRSIGEQAPQPFPQKTPQNPAPDGFVRVRLERVRKHLDKIDRMMEAETDPAKIDRLAAASSKFEEQERRLSDRSLPPVRRAQDQAPAKLGYGSSLFMAGMDE